MEIEIGALLRRIQKIEDTILGGDKISSTGTSEMTVLDNLLTFNSDMGAAINGRERIQNVFRKVQEIDRFLDPHWLDLEKSQSQSAKAEVILSEENNIKKMVENLETLNRMKPVMDSKAIEDTPDLMPALAKVRSAQANLNGTAEAVLSETRRSLSEQSAMINDLNRLFINWDENLTTLEMAKIRRNLPKE